MKKFFLYFIASFGGLGFSPYVSGTVGSLGGVMLFYLAHFLQWSLTAYLILTGFLFVLGIWSSSIIEKETRLKDPGVVVIDEVVGMLITYAGFGLNLKILITGFVLFRLLDIVKPFPANKCEKLRGGMGIMMDDVVSGIYAWGALYMIIWLTS